MFSGHLPEPPGPRRAESQGGWSVARSGEGRQRWPERGRTPGPAGPPGRAGPARQGARRGGGASRLRAGADGDARGRLGDEAERRQPPPHRVGLGDGAEDAARAGTARTDEDVDREHAAEKLGPGSSASVRRLVMTWVTRRSKGTLPVFFSQRPKNFAWWTSSAAR